MANPLFQAMGGGSMNGSIGGYNFMQLFSQFQNFRRNFKGDPQQVVNQMLASGKLSQDQLNQAQSMAQQFMQMMPK